MSGMITAKAVLPRWPFEVRAGDPSKILVLTPEEERESPYFLIGDPAVQVATRPVGLDAVELVWEVNDLLPYDARRYRAVTAVFTPYGQEEFLKNKSFEILTSKDGKTFIKIAQVHGPTNQYLHREVETGRLYYYKVRAFDEDGKLMAESPVTMGAAGKNLFSQESFENLTSVPADDKDAVCIVLGTRPYSQSQRLVRLQPSATAKQVLFYGNLFPISPKKTYLQGGWVRAPGNVWHGRWFFDPEKKEMHCWGYSMMAVRNTPEWTFAVQQLIPDTDGSGFPRKGGQIVDMARKQWMFPPEAGHMAVFLTAFGPGESGDFWVVELSQAPEASSAPITKR